MISERLSNDIPPKIKILNMVIPILMHLCSFVSKWSENEISLKIEKLICALIRFCFNVFSYKMQI